MLITRMAAADNILCKVHSTFGLWNDVVYCEILFRPTIRTLVFPFFSYLSPPYSFRFSWTCCSQMKQVFLRRMEEIHKLLRLRTIYLLTSTTSICSRHAVYMRTRFTRLPTVRALGILWVIGILELAHTLTGSP